MHCEACKALIRMELEENGFADRISTVEIGNVHLTGVTRDESARAGEIINSLEGYHVAD
ncbi:MAG: hypothetical protein TR69_WS6001001137 [candidate division WS6 bacterium OLB20]|uniref:HMA domain-containing protein n=1 Tax=candidate division WS6 bacterium OLB20 TaxID=1617426 RepID=A0A136LWW9_9BACT|nr:MAG: hypothetical protein TR69_WS6001001137 [candidate division WS6 bacterium OLB20]